jgi:lipopolysaccharide export LptBFGC system permease protein LptF
MQLSSAAEPLAGSVPQRRRLPPRSVSRRYAAGLLGEVAWHTMIVLAVVEAIFLSDLIISELLPRVLDQQGGIFDLLLLILLGMPEGLFLALPIALVVSVYLVFLRRREAGEMMVLAGMGRGGGNLVAAGLFIGALGCALSLLLSGYVEPHARYTMQRTYSEMALRSLRTGDIPTGTFFEFGDFAIFASRGQLANLASGVFIHQHLSPTRNRITMASRTLGLDVEGGSRKGILLEDATALEFDLGRPAAAPAANEAGCAGCGPSQRITPVTTASASYFLAELPSLRLPDTVPRGASAEERTLPELIEGPSGDSVTKVLTTELLRALICLAAPLLALLAVAFSRPATLLFALPGAAAVVLGLSFFGPRAIEWVLPLGLAQLAGCVLLAMSLAITATALLVKRYEAGCIGPARVRL